MTSIPFDKENLSLICEVDEQWSFIGKKKNRRWLWYAWEPRYKRIIAHAFGKRNTDALRYAPHDPTGRFSVRSSKEAVS